MKQSHLDVLNGVYTPEPISFDEAVANYLQSVITPWYQVALHKLTHSPTPRGLEELTFKEGKKLVELMGSATFSEFDILFKYRGCLCHVSPDSKVTAFEEEQCIAKEVPYVGNFGLTLTISRISTANFETMPDGNLQQLLTDLGVSIRVGANNYGHPTLLNYLLTQEDYTERRNQLRQLQANKLELSNEYVVGFIGDELVALRADGKIIQADGTVSDAASYLSDKLLDINLVNLLKAHYLNVNKNVVVKPTHSGETVIDWIARHEDPLLNKFLQALVAPRLPFRNFEVIEGENTISKVVGNIEKRSYSGFGVPFTRLTSIKQLLPQLDARTQNKLELLNRANSMVYAKPVLLAETSVPTMWRGGCNKDVILVYPSSLGSDFSRVILHEATHAGTMDVSCNTDSAVELENVRKTLVKKLIEENPNYASALKADEVTMAVSDLKLDPRYYACCNLDEIMAASMAYDMPVLSQAFSKISPASAYSLWKVSKGIVTSPPEPVGVAALQNTVLQCASILGKNQQEVNSQKELKELSIALYQLGKGQARDYSGDLNDIWEGRIAATTELSCAVYIDGLRNNWPITPERKAEILESLGEELLTTITAHLDLKLEKKYLDCLNGNYNPEPVAWDESAEAYLVAMSTELTLENGKKLIGLLEGITLSEKDQLFTRNGCLCHVSPDNRVTVFEGEKCIAKEIAHTGDLKDFVLPGDELGTTKHVSWVYSVAYSPNGKEILTGGEDGTARRWDRFTGEQLGKEMKHDGYIYSVAYSPDGKEILTGSDDCTARRWDRYSGKMLGEMKHGDSVRSVTYSPDGQEILTGSEDNTARRWDRYSGKMLGEMKHGNAARSVINFVRSVTYSPDGQEILTGSDDCTARRWDRYSGKMLGEMKHGDCVRSVTYSPDGQEILTGSDDYTVRRWDRVTSEQLGEMKAYAYRAPVVYSPDGKEIMTGSRGGNITDSDCAALRWDRFTGEQLGKVGKEKRYGYTVTSFAYSPDGKEILTGDCYASTRYATSNYYHPLPIVGRNKDWQHKPQELGMDLD